MKATEVIKRLQDTVNTFGDLDVVIYTEHALEIGDDAHIDSVEFNGDSEPDVIIITPEDPE